MMEERLNTEESFDYSDRIISGEEAQAVHDIQKEFLVGYVKSKDTMTVEEWLPAELGRQLPEKHRKK